MPKHLSDLARVDADLRIVCRRCGFEEDWTRAELAEHLRAIGGSQVWSEITRHLRCRSFGCGSIDLRALPVPYARRGANVARRIGRLDAHLLAAALGVLEAAANRSRVDAVATLEVRLALLVLCVPYQNWPPNFKREAHWFRCAKHDTMIGRCATERVSGGREEYQVSLKT